MDNPAKSLHGTCVAAGNNAILLRGESGAGKSDLALRFLHFHNTDQSNQKHYLVADDRVIVMSEKGKLIARSPENIAGLIEVRGVGLISCQSISKAELRIVADLVSEEQVPRLQYPFDEDSYMEIEGLKVPCIKIFPFEASAPIKLRYWIDLASSENNDQLA